MTASRWWNPLTVFLAVIVAVLLIFGLRLTFLIGQVNRAVHTSCEAANATADVWNNVITQSIDAEQRSTDTPEQKAQQIEALRKDRFPHQEC